jgi:hypothetical protein
MMADKKPPMGQKVRIRKMRGPEIYLKTVNGKVYGGMVFFKGVEPSRPVIWFGDKSYAVWDATTKKNTLTYDTLSGSLIKNADQKDIDISTIMTQVSQSLVTGALSAKDTMGVQDARNDMAKWATLGLLGFFIILLVFAYLIFTHVPGGAGAAVSSAPTGSGLIGGNVIPVG